MASFPTVGTYSSPLDIANRACQHMGVRRLITFSDDTVQASELNFNYNPLRQNELRRDVWRFSIRKCMLRPISTTSGKITPAAWTNVHTYLQGSVVSYNGVLYQARTGVPAAQEPDTSPVYWEQFFHSVHATAWVAGGATNNPQPWAPSGDYAAGTIVIGSDNNNYMSNFNGNTGHNPVTDGGVNWTFLGPAALGSGYQAGELVYDTALNVYISLTNGNTDNPSSAPAAFVSTQNYDIGDTITASSVVYQSTTDFNAGGAGAPGTGWETIPATQPDQITGTTGTAWLKLGNAGLSAWIINYPLGTGPSEQTTTLNVYPLPNGFLREAPQEPKGGSTSYLGAPSGDAYRDWTYGDDFFTTRTVEPTTFRFAADITVVSNMDPMFCETLAARQAIESVERVTQSSEKLQAIEQTYKKFRDDAVTVNGIETGSTEPALDDYITCRL